jgi:diguanylate cyclase (GGDEF)-like protein
MEAINATQILWLPSLASALVASLSFALLVHALSKMRSVDPITALVWWGAGAVSVGGGLWAAQLYALCSVAGPASQLFRPAPLGLAWVAGVAGITLILSSVHLKWSNDARIVLQALCATAVWALLYGLAINSFGLPPRSAGSLMKDLPWSSIALVAAGAKMGLWFSLGTRWERTGSATARKWFGATAFGLVAGMAQVMALGGLSFAPISGVRGLAAGIEPLSMQLAAAAGTLIVMLGLFSALIDSRAHGRNRVLASSLSEANRRLRELAMADSLTRLPNRLMFEERLAECLARTAQSPEALAVLFIDLDGFKPINDSFGHLAGDVVLREVGRRLQSLARQGDTVARIGGDEFLMLAEHPAGDVGAAAMAQRVLKAISNPYTLPNDVEVNLSCSIGIVMYPEHGPSQKLIANADAAMYAAKRAGGATYAFFEPRMELDASEQLTLQKDLRHALDHGELELFYQPKIDGRSGQITGAEALVRWHHPVRGLILPSIFIPVAERFGLIGILGNWVIDESCRQLRDWINQGLRMRVAVNLSVHQLRQDDLVDRIQAAVQRNGIDATLLTFEITESVAMEDTQVTMKAFAHLARIGSTVSIDDFGTGYSSLAYLRKLPARQLKIDRSFVADLDTSTDALAVVDAVVKLAHALGLRVVAEGVETERQRDILLSLHCDELQGYLFARPMSAKLLTLWAMGEDGTQPQDFRPSLYAEGVHSLLE